MTRIWIFKAPPLVFFVIILRFDTVCEPICGSEGVEHTLDSPVHCELLVLV